MYKKISLSIILLFTVSCVQENDKRVSMFNEYSMKLLDSEEIINLKKEERDLYKAIKGKHSKQIPLYKCIKGKNHLIFIGLPVDIDYRSLKKICQELNNENLSIAKKDLLRNYLGEHYDNVRYLPKKLDKNLLFIILINKSNDSSSVNKNLLTRFEKK